MYELKLANYTGPLDKLLELIEERRLEISEISLAQVTDDFLRYLEKIRKAEEKVGKTDLRLLADFIVVASRLIFIKSKTLLPGLALTPEEEAGVRDLADRLRFYKEMKPALRLIIKLWRAEREEFSRPYFLNAVQWAVRPAGRAAESRIFFPGENLSVAGLAGAMGKVWANLAGFLEEKQVIREKIISLEDKVAEVIKCLEKLAETTFAKLSGASSKTETIITFLAVLHLAREQLIFLEQKGHFSDILIRKSEHGT